MPLGLHTCLRKKPLFKKFQIDFMPGAGKETQYNISHSPQNTFCSKRKKKKEVMVGYKMYWPVSVDLTSKS